MTDIAFRQSLKEIVGTIREYGNRLLGGLTPNELSWIPEGTRGRTIQSYLRHIINAEVYWLKNLGDNSFEYFQRATSFNDLLEAYNQLGRHIAQLIENSSNDDLTIRTPVFEEKIQKEKGTLAWTVGRTSLHAIHHFAQVSYIRYSLENPPSEGPITWGNVIDAIVFLFNANG
jgi:uncharacterized damage-inducible protein DinB